MSKIDEVRKAMFQAMKDKDTVTKEAASELLTALKNAQIDKRDGDLTEDEEKQYREEGNPDSPGDDRFIPG